MWFGAHWAAVIHGISSAPAGLFHYDSGLACLLVLPAVNDERSQGMHHLWLKTKRRKTSMHTTARRLHNSETSDRILRATFRLITPDESPFSLSFSSVLTGDLFCSCTLSCKKDSFMRSISSSTKDIWNKRLFIYLIFFKMLRGQRLITHIQAFMIWTDWYLHRCPFRW